MEVPTTPKHPRVTTIQLDSDLGRTPSQPTSHCFSSTKITEAKANLKTILAPRVSYNDPNIVDLIKPNEVSSNFVQAVMKDILEDQVVQDLPSASRLSASKATLGTSGLVFRLPILTIQVVPSVEHYHSIVLK